MIWFYLLMIPTYSFLILTLTTTLMNLVNSETLKLSDWFKANKLFLNIQKSNYIIFKPRQRRDELTLSIEMDGFKMNQVKEVNFLGVILDETLSWKPHISQVESAVSKSVGVIRKSSFCFTRTALCTLYYSLVYSYLQYCILAWGSTYPTHLRRLVLLQKRIIRIISKKGFDAHTNPLFKSLMILKLEDIYSLYLGKFMFSLKKNSVPSSFSRSILRTNQVHGYNTRSSKKIYIPFCRTNVRHFSVFFYQGPVFFNKLNAFICDAPSLYSFQSRVKNFLLSCY